MKLFDCLFFQRFSQLIEVASTTGHLDPSRVDGVVNKDCQVDNYHSTFSKHFDRAQCRLKGMRVLFAFIKTLKWSWLLLVIGRLLLTSFIVLSPILTSQILTLVKTRASSTYIIEALALLVLQKGIKSLLAVHIDYRQCRMGCILYGQLACLIYERRASQGRFNKGRILNLLEDDSYRLINVTYFVIELVMVPIQIAYGVYILCWSIGLRLLNTHVYIFGSYVLMCGVLAWIDFNLNRKLMVKKDCRSELVLNHIKHVSEATAAQCTQARSIQLKNQRTLFGLEIITRSLSSIICSLMLVVALISLSGEINQSQVFSLILLFNELRYPCMLLPSLISNFIQNYVSMCRLEEELLKFAGPTNTIGNENEQPLLMDGPINAESLHSEELMKESTDSLTQRFYNLRSLDIHQTLMKISIQTNEELFSYYQLNKTVKENIILYQEVDNVKLEKICLLVGLSSNNLDKIMADIVKVNEQTYILVGIARQLYFNGNLILTKHTLSIAKNNLQQNHILRILYNIKTESNFNIYVSVQIADSIDDRIRSVDADSSTQQVDVESLQLSISATLPGEHFEHQSRGIIGLNIYSRYLRMSGCWHLIMIFLVCCVTAQSLSIWSTLTYRDHTKQPTITFTFDSLLFLLPFMSILPTCIGLVALFTISIKASRNSFALTIQSIKGILKNFSPGVIANRLSNDLKFFDKNFCICIYDIGSTGCAILGSVGLCLMAIYTYDYKWMLAMMTLFIGLAISMHIFSRKAMWALRQCLRVEGCYRTLSIGHLYQTNCGLNAIIYYSKQSEVRQQYINIINRIVNTHLNAFSVEVWFEIRLLMLSLVGCTAMCALCLSLDLQPSLVGVMLSYTLSLDDLFQTFFLNSISLEKAGVAVQRYLDLTEKTM